jgi:hypothetical protein
MESRIELVVRRQLGANGPSSVTAIIVSMTSSADRHVAGVRR